MVLGKLDIHMNKSYIRFLSNCIPKMNSKWIANLTWKYILKDTILENVKVLEESERENSMAVVKCFLTSKFLNMNPKAQKTKIDLCNKIKPESFCTAKEKNNIVKSNPRTGQNAYKLYFWAGGVPKW
jgi:hypothetical protein